MIIEKNNKFYSIENSPKTVIDNNTITVKIGKCENELNTKEVATLICLLTNLIIGKEIKKCPNCGQNYTDENFCSNCGCKLK